MHTEQPLTGFVYVGWNKMIEKIKDQRAGLAGSEGLGSTEQDVLEGRVLGKLPKAWGSSPHEWAAGGGKEEVSLWHSSCLSFCRIEGVNSAEIPPLSHLQTMTPEHLCPSEWPQYNKTEEND